MGVNRYTVRGNAGAVGAKDDTSGEVPLGGGIRSQIGAFTLDARGDYLVPFDQNFAAGVPTSDLNVGSFRSDKSGRYQATVNLGGRF